MLIVALGENEELEIIFHEEVKYNYIQQIGEGLL